MKILYPVLFWIICFANGIVATFLFKDGSPIAAVVVVIGPAAGWFLCLLQVWETTKCFRAALTSPKTKN